MADDTMEISSEHGHDGGDGDIDIDFDFTSAQVDEDYVLEDAGLNADFGDNFHPQPSPAMGNDDLMIDEDVDSYPMDDADLLHDEDGHTMEHEVLPFPTEDPLHFEEDRTDRTQFGADDSNNAADYTYAQQESSEPQAVGEDASLRNSGDRLHQEDLQSEEVMAVPDTEKLSTEPCRHDSRTASPFQSSPQSVGSAQVPRSPPASNPERGPISPDHTSNEPETKLTSLFLSADASKAEEIVSSDGGTILPPPRHVIVVYQSVEYALFSSSELDDPDSFFLSDISIAEKPLAELFKAIRQVIQEDLTDEDELCMAVEDLGIETEERSSALLHNITLTEILNLREKLLRNDGVESLRPMYVILGTRTNFSKRLENLIAGATAGKGLSQLVAWDEHSESLDDLGEANESKNDVESILKSQELDTVPGAGEDEDQTAHGIENGEPKELGPEHEQELKPEPTGDTTLGIDESVPTSRDDSVQEYNAPDANISSLQAATQNGNPSNDDYDEDDLIDYSEEEGDEIPAVQRHVKSIPTYDSRANHEYEAINEDLRQRSISRTSEDRVFDNSNEQETAATEGNFEGPYVEEDDIEHEEHNENQEEFENSNLNAVHEDFTTGDFDAAGSLEQYDDAGLLADELGGEGEFAEEGVIGGSYDMFGTEAQEYDYGDEDALEDDNGDPRSLQLDEAPVGNSQNSISGNRNNLSEAEVAEDNLEQADTAESSVTIGADEIQYEDGLDKEVFDNSETTADSQALNGKREQSVGVVHDDEIDYEDNEEEDGKEKDSGAITPLTPASVLPASNGKRSRADVDSDDALNMSSKDTKRHRS